MNIDLMKASAGTGNAINGSKTNDELIADLEAVFQRKKLPEEFKEERSVYEDLIPKLV